jgi:hypothetical protein
MRRKRPAAKDFRGSSVVAPRRIWAMTRSAGQKLRAKMNRALRDSGIVGAEFDEYELEALDAACAAADRAEQLQLVYDAALASGDARETTLVRLSAEIRHCDRQSLQMLERVRLTPEPPKSVRHQRAVQRRWDRQRKRNEARVGPRPMQVVVE